MRSADVAKAARIGVLPAQPDPSDAGLPEKIESEERRLVEELERPWAHVWVAREREDAEPVGLVVVWKVADEVHVLNVATDPAWRRRGVALALMQHLLDFARDNEARHVLLEVRKSNAPAIALYRKLGFYAMGVRRRYYADDEDAVEMVLVFDEQTREIVRRADEVRLEGA